MFSDKYVNVSEWQGATCIHIQSYFSPEESYGKLIPTKKGVALTIDEWRALKNWMGLIDSKIAQCEDRHILQNQPENSTNGKHNPPKSLIPEECQLQPTGISGLNISEPPWKKSKPCHEPKPIGLTLSQPPMNLSRSTPYCEPEPFDQ